MKQLVLVVSLLMAQQSICISPIYKVLDTFGALTDYILTKGDLSPENVALFNQVANDLGIANREIKAKNSGFLLRLFSCYHNPIACQWTNRVYLNDSVINALTPNERKFIIAHELTHHQGHHLFKRDLLIYLLSIIQVALTYSTCLDNNESYLHKYMTNGWSLAGIEFNIFALIFAQYVQQQELAADANALLSTDIDMQDAEKALQHLHYPDTKEWPLYGRILWFFNYYIIEYFCTLPIVKEHVPHIASFKDRIKALKKEHQESSLIFKNPALVTI